MARKKRETRFPSQIYIWEETSSEGCSWYNASENFEHIVSVGEKKFVGLYTLTATSEVIGTVQVRNLVEPVE